MSTRHRSRLLIVGLLLFGTGLYLVLAQAILGTAIQARRHPLETTPITDGLRAEPVAFSSAGEDLTLRGFLLHGATRQVIVLLHGLDSNCWRGWHRDLARAYVDHGFNVLLFNLRGHGDSGGSTLGLAYQERHDVKGGVDWLLEHGFRPGSIGIHGTSYGAATALIATAHIPEIAAVVADSAFADFRDVVDGELERRIGSFAILFKPALTLFFESRFDVPLDRISPLAAVPAIAPRPILFIHGEADTRIPPEHTRRLIAASKSPVTESLFVPGASHAQAFNTDRALFLQKVFAFFDRHLEKAGR